MEAQNVVRARLESDRAKLQRELAALNEAESGAGGQESGYATHAADHGSDTYDQERSLALVRHVEGGLGQVERALQKLNDGTYGRCDHCGQAIDASRLEALPQAALCMKCQNKSEGRR